MPEIRPFAGIRYASRIDLAKVTSPPYDVISAQEHKQLLTRDPFNFVRLILPEDGPEKYSNAAAVLRTWLAEKVLVSEPEEAFYVYRMDYLHRGAETSTAGLIGALRLHSFDEGGLVLPHEKTMPGPKQDRLDLMRHTHANLEPLWFVASSGVPEMTPLVESLQADEPYADMADVHGVRHRCWKVGASRGEAAAREFQERQLVVADGHHRYETAITYRDEMRAKAGAGAWDFTLAFVGEPLAYPPTLLPIHRVATGVSLPDLEERARIESFQGGFEELATKIDSTGPGTIGIAARQGLWTLVAADPLDTAYLQTLLAELGAQVSFEHDLQQVKGLVQRGSIAFLVAQVAPSTVIEYALRRMRMPPKTTFFWPKPLSGIVLRDLLD